MQDKDRPRVREIVRNVFPVLVRSSFGFGSQTLVYESDGRVRGGIVLKFFPLPSGSTGGLVSWIFVDPGDQGSGIGKRLLTEGLSALEANGCTHLFADIAGDNTALSRLFASEGFREISAGALFDTYGIGALGVIANTQHLFDVGHALWRKPPQSRPPRPGMQLVSTLALHIPIALLYLIRSLRVENLEAVMVYRLSGVLALLILLRLAATWITARVAGVRLRYRMWERGMPLGMLVAAGFGVIFPIPGSLYPREPGWSFEKYARVLALASVAGVAAVAATGGLAAVLMRLADSPAAVGWLVWVRRSAVALLVVDAVLPVYPFDAYAANRVRRYSVPAWVLLAAFSIAAAMLIAV
ncbi:MAG: N-acetyltransferase family protein [Spirochaetales bacterium]